MKTLVLEMNGPAHTTAYVLLRDGKLAGRAVANHSKNPNGSVCTATIWLYDRFEASGTTRTHGTGKAGGYGYDKLSAAIYSAYNDMTGKYPEGFSGGDGEQIEFFRSLGYEVIQAV